MPADAIKGSVQAELKIYPNLLAHVTEGFEGILRRPYGCGEQTISSTYPNVMALRLLKSTGQGEEGRTAAIAMKARKFAQAGYDRLLGYRTASGGFGYWSKGEADLALRRFSGLGHAAVALALASGVANSWFVLHRVDKTQ